MKNVILYLSMSVAFMNCSSKQKQTVFLFNDISFKLNDNEEIVKIDPKKKEIFRSYFNEKSTQIPLFKCIKSDSYLIFIGIPFNTSIKQLANDSMKSILNQTFFEGDSTNYFYKKLNNQKEQITIYTRNFSNNWIYVLTVSNSAKASDSLFTIKALSNRFNQ